MRRFETLQEQQKRFVQCKTKIKKLLDDCLEKELTFNVNPDAENISVFKIVAGEFIFSYDCYYFGELEHINHDSTIPLDELIKKVKAYKKIR